MSKSRRDSKNIGKSAASNAVHQGRSSSALAMPAPASHTQSRTWVNPAAESRPMLRKLNEARRKLCKDSPFFHQNFNLKEHRQDIASDFEEAFRRKTERRINDLAARQRYRKFDNSHRVVAIEPAFGGRTFKDNRAAVLSLETVFSRSYEVNRIHHYPYTLFPDGEDCPCAGYAKELAPWPSKAEAKYEGDERISTDRLHGRALPVPRTSGNDTVNWMQRTMIEAYPFDDYYPRYYWDESSWQVECFFKTHVVAELEVGSINDDGVSVISDEVMAELDS